MLLLTRRLTALGTTCIGILSGVSVPAQNFIPAAGFPPDFPAFRRQVIDADFSSGYQTGIADIDGDGRTDILALSTEPTRLHWYHNPEWTKHVITTKTYRNIDIAPYDIDGDGDMDLALASQFRLQETTTGGLLHWLECPADPTQEWTVRDIDAIPTSHRIRWGDLDGDGRAELVNLPLLGVGAQPPEYNVGLMFKVYCIPKNPRTEPWPAVTLDSTLQMAHGLSIVRWNDDTRDDVLAVSFAGVDLYLMCGPGMAWDKRHIGAGDRSPRPKQGASEVALGTVAGKRCIATIEPWHGNQVVHYLPESEKLPWRRTVIDTTFNDGHCIAFADFDGDGNDEIVAGHRGPSHNLFIYRWLDARKQWQRIPLDAGGIAAAGVRVVDFNGDGRLDVAATGSSTGNVVYYENLGKR